MDKSQSLLLALSTHFSAKETPEGNIRRKHQEETPEGNTRRKHQKETLEGNTRRKHQKETPEGNTKRKQRLTTCRKRSESHIDPYLWNVRWDKLNLTLTFEAK